MHNAIGHRMKYCLRYSFFNLLGLSFWFYAPIALAQTQWTWMKVPNMPSMVVDETWGPDYGKSGSRFATSASGIPYLSLTDWLYRGDKDGLNWTPIAARKSPYPNANSNPAFAISADEKMIHWDNQISLNAGRTWSKATYVSFPFDAFAFLGGNSLLGGGGVETVWRSPDFGKTWQEVHFGPTYSGIQAFLPTWTGIFALPAHGSLIYSRDEGSTWEAIDSVKPTFPESHFLNLEQKAYQQIAWEAEQLRTGKIQLKEIPIPNSSEPFTPFPHASIGGPDSTLTAFSVSASINAGDKSFLWMGSWGQGVFVSEDRGATFRPVNQGLTDLHIEALWSNSHGTVLALTRSGMYRLTGILAMASRTPRNKPQRQNAVGIKRGQIFQSGETKSIRGVDGRCILNQNP